MTTADSVRRAANPQAAMLAIAEGIDTILAQRAEALAAIDPWGEWIDDAEQDMAASNTTELFIAGQRAGKTAAMERMAQGDPVLAASLREKLATTADGEERRALEAALRLAEENGIVPADSYAEAGVTATLQQGEDEVLIELPEPDPTRFSQRKAWAKQVRLGTMFVPPMDDNVAAHAYAQGGPLWLYHGNDELVRALPLGWRQMMVTDIEHDSPQTAQVVARDILKADAEDAMGDAPTLAGLTGNLA